MSTPPTPAEVVLPRYLQLLWDREPAGRRGPRPGRTIAQIGAAGVTIADRGGLEGVSMKAVAAELGLTSMSLYRYVDSRQELLLVMVDTAYGPPDLALVDRGSWRERLAAWAGALARGLVAHPWILEVPMMSPPLTPHVLGWMDAGVRAFADLRLDAQQKLSSLLVVDGWTRSHVAMSVQLGAVAGSDGAASAGPDDVYLTTLPHLVDAQRFPALAAATPALADNGDFFADELAFGLRLVLDGIEALARAQEADAGPGARAVRVSPRRGGAARRA